MAARISYGPIEMLKMKPIHYLQGLLLLFCCEVSRFCEQRSSDSRSCCVQKRRNSTQGCLVIKVDVYPLRIWPGMLSLAAESYSDKPFELTFSGRWYCSRDETEENRSLI